MAARGRFLAILFALLLGVAMVTVSACGGDDEEAKAPSAAAESKDLVFSAYSREPEFIRAAVKGLQRSAAGKEWKLETLFANNEPTLQVSQIENAITKKPDVIISWANDREAVIPVARQAQDAGITVVTMGQDFAAKGADAREFFVSQRYEDVGAEKARVLVDLLDGKGKVGIIRGIRGADFTEKQGKGADAVLEKESGIDIVAEQYAGAYASDAGLKTGENLITANPGINGLYVDNDDLAVGVLEALEERKLLDKVVVVSTDGTPAALDAVRKGRLEYTQALCGVDDGKRMIDALAKFFAGQDPGDFVETKRIQVTPDTIADKEAELAGCS